MQVSLLNLALKACLIVIGVFLAGAIILWQKSSQPREAIYCMAIAGGVCLVSSIISLMPITNVMKQKDRKEAFAQMAMTGTSIRLLLTLMGGVGAYWMAVPKTQVRTFMFSLACFYCTLLLWETTTVAKIGNFVFKETAPSDNSANETNAENDTE